MLVGCSTDDSIDLSDIDTTIGVNTDSLSIPGGGTNDFVLGDVLELTDNDAIQTLPADSGRYKKGDYQFKKSDKVEAAHPQVEQVQFSADGANQTETFPVNIPEWMAKITEYTSGVDQDFVFPFTFDETGWMAETMASASIVNPMKYYHAADPMRVTTFNYNGKGNDNIMSLTQASIDGSVTLEVKFNQLSSMVRKMQLDIVLPDFLGLDIDQEKLKNAGYTAEFVNDTLKLGNVGTTETFRLPLVFNELKNFDAQVDQKSKQSKDSSYLVLNDHELAMQGAVKMRIRINSKDFMVKEKGNFNIDADVDMSKYITVTHAEGYFKPDITLDPSVINVGNDLPDFLTDPEANILFANPTIKLLVSSNLNERVFISGKIVAYRDEAMTDSIFMYLDSLTLHEHTGNVGLTTKSLMVINRQELTEAEKNEIAAANSAYYEGIVMNGTKAKRYPNAADAAHETCDIADLLNPIPKKLKFVFDPETDVNYKATIDLYDPAQPNGRGRRYAISPSYEFVAPLALQQNAQIVYNDTIDDWNKDIADNDIELRDGDKIEVTADFYNGTPLELRLKPTVVDKNKNPLSGVIVNEIVVPSNLGKDMTETTPVRTTLRFANGSDFKNLDGLIFRVIAKAIDETPLNAETQKVKISNIRLNINGHVSIDVDSDDKKKK